MNTLRSTIPRRIRLSLGHRNLSTSKGFIDSHAFHDVGIFASIAAAEAGAIVTVLEAGSDTLSKVKISGGGRCNVLHDTAKAVPELLAGYPRGRRELNGILHKHFSPKMAQEWFTSRGVTLKTENDGRMFPTTDNSQTIIKALLESADDASVSIKHRAKVEEIKIDGSKFVVDYLQKNQGSEKESFSRAFDAVILATGSAPIGYKLASSLGLDMVPTVPSLFTLNAKLDVKEGGVLHGLSGVSVPLGKISYQVLAQQPTLEVPGDITITTNTKKSVLEQQGPLLITHHGLSGPAALRLSAFGARELNGANYRGKLTVHWAPSLGNVDDVFEALWMITGTNPKKTVSSICPLFLSDGSTALPRRLWASLVGCSGFALDQTWGQASKKITRQLALLVTACPLQLTGKGTFKEEFVTAGGVDLKQMDMKTMQVKSCPGLFVCGELLNVDGVTGGFNFMNCWGTGYVAGSSAATFSAQSLPSNQDFSLVED